MRCPPSLLCLLLLPVLLTTGCAAASAVGAAIGAALSGLAYLSDGTVVRTFVVPLPEVWQASLTVLHLMDLPVTAGTRDEHTGELTGAAPDLTVTLTMSSVTARATRVSIEAANGTLGGDRATAAEVLNQLALLLAPTPVAGQPGADARVPPPRDPRGAPSAGPGDVEEAVGGVEVSPPDAREVGDPSGGAGKADQGLPVAGEAGAEGADGWGLPQTPLGKPGGATDPVAHPPVPAEQAPLEG